ncbi:MAG: T9SS type A sorting domain-containing protein [Bacteroidia bacterium]
MKKLYTILCFLACLSVLKASTFTSNVVTGVWSASSSWVVTGAADSDGIPDADDDVIILSGHSITLNVTTNTCKTININSGGKLVGNTKKLNLKGDFTNSGTVSGNLELFVQANCIFTSVPTFTCNGNIWVQNASTLTFAAGTTLSKKGPIIMQTSGTSVVNNGSISLINNGSVLGTIQFKAASGTRNSWTNAAGSSLNVQGNMIISAGTHTFNCTASSNTVIYSGTSTNFFNTTYNNLSFTGNTVKTLTTTLNVTGNLLISGTSNTVNVNGKKLNIGGNLTTNGVLSCATGTIAFNGTSASVQTVSGTKTFSVSNLEINNTGGSGVIFTNSVSVTDVLTMVSGDCNSNDKLILASTSSGTARIAPVPASGCSFSGNLIIKKFIDDMPGTYYDLSSPVQATNVMDWDNEIYISGVGTYDGQAGPQGVDGSCLNGLNTMNTYDEVTNTFVAITGTNTILSPGTGYQLFLAGDNINFWNATTIDSRGVPNYGDLLLDNGGAGLSYSDLTGMGWHLIGNPYASYIDYTYMQANTNSAMTDNIYYTDAGNYSLWTFGNIPPFQGFYVETNPDPFYHAVLFTEACKTTDQTTSFHRNASMYDMKIVISSQLTPFSHENTINFNNQATVNYDSKFDATYRKFPDPVAPALYMITPKRNLIKNVVDSKQEELTIPLGIFTPKAGVYYLDASILNTDAYNYVWLENVKTGAKYDLNNSVAIDGTELGTNTDYVLRLSKTQKSSSISESILETDLVIFNTENTINFKSSLSNHSLSEVMVYDMTGKLVLSQSNIDVVIGNITKVDVSFLSTGIYVVSATDEQGRKTTVKLIK